MGITVGDDAHVAVMRKAGQILLYVKEHEGHPQEESLRSPNRVAIDEGYYASVSVERNVPIVLIWDTDKADELPCAIVSRQTFTTRSAMPGTEEKTITVDEVDFLITKFQTLLNMSFFKG